MNSIKYLLFTCLTILCQFGWCQTDSLKNKLEQNLTDAERVTVLLRLGRLYQSTNLDSAELYGESAKVNATSVNDSTLIRVHDLLGSTFASKGQYDKAMSHFVEGLKLSEKIRNKYFEIAFLTNIGTIYDRQLNYEKAEENYLRSIKIINEHSESKPFSNKSYYLANIYNNLANVYGNRKDTATMMLYYEKALVHSRAMNDITVTSLILNNIGNIELNKRDFESALNNLKAALALRKLLNDGKGLAQSYRNLGYYYNKLKQSDSAIYYFNQSIKAAKAVGSLQELVDSKAGLAETYEQKGQINQALQEFKQYKILNDSLYYEKRNSEIAKIESQYQFEKQQAQFNTERKKKELQFYIMLSILSGLTITLVLLILYQRSRLIRGKLLNQHLVLEQKSIELERENLNIALAYNNKEMTTKVLYLYKKNELVYNVINQLNELVNNLKSENKPIIRRVIKNLGEVLNDDSWKEFEVRFNEIHDAFYKTLEKDFPELTPNERKLCAFLKLNMTSKEISSLTGQSIRSIDVARTRLRKKLNLTNSETNLVDFFSSI